MYKKDFQAVLDQEGTPVNKHRGFFRRELMEEKTIPAIETNYNGYKTRSRLEARWLYFFDLIGLKYEYESEGFKDDKTGLYYLPDVYLPAFNCYVEIKSAHVKDTPEGDEAERKLSKFFGDIDQPIALILYGDPYEYEARCKCVTESLSGDAVGSEWLTATFELSPYGLGVVLVCRSEYDDDLPLIWGLENGLLQNEMDFIKYEEMPILGYTATVKDSIFQFFKGLIHEAGEQARQARFEHGENPDRTVGVDHENFESCYRGHCMGHMTDLILHYAGNCWWFDEITSAWKQRNKKGLVDKNKRDQRNRKELTALFNKLLYEEYST